MKLPALALIPLVVLLLAGCSVAPGGKATPTAPAVATASPAAVVSASPSSTASTASPEPSRTPEPPFPVPPRGILASGATSVEGWTGSYCWQTVCADAEGLPPKAELPQVTARDDPLEFSLSDGATFTRWTVMYGAGNANSDLTILDQGGAPSDPDAETQSTPPDLHTFEFDSPPTGDWTLTVSVEFPGGDLSYAWHVIAQ
jgi:hypothetical protein